MELKGDIRKLQAEYIKDLRKVTPDKLVRGALVEAIGSSEDGFVFTDGRNQKTKKFIIIGVDKIYQEFYGVLVINSDMNPKAGYSDEYLSAQYKLYQENYADFLRYDSYADCSVIMRLPLERLLNGEYYEKLSDEDFKGVFEILETSDILTTKQKKRYNIKRR